MQAPEPEERLAELARQWLSMPRSTAHEKATADRFYVERILPPLLQRFREMHAARFRGRYYGVIYTVGTSWAPLVLSWSAVEPQRALFLHTKDTESVLDRVVDTLGLRPSQFDKAVVDKTDPTPIYEAVRRYWASWHSHGRLAVDFTAGTKAMVSGASMAGAVLGMDLLYVASDAYDQHLNRPVPGTERLVTVANPLTVFGDLEEQEAYRLASLHDWAAVRQVAASLQVRIPSPRYRALEQLARAYQAWDNLDLRVAAGTLRELTRWLTQEVPLALLPPWLVGSLDRLQAQAEMLSCIAEVDGQALGRQTRPESILSSREAAAALCATLLAAAQRRAERAAYDLAALLLYRAVELIAQRRLHRHGIDPANIQPACFPAECNDEQRLLKAVNQRLEQIPWFRYEYAVLPKRAGLVLAYVLLDVLRDPLLEGIDIKEIANRAEVRNHSWLVHGFNATDGEQYARFEKTARRLADAFFRLEGLHLNEWLERATFVQPGGLSTAPTGSSTP